MPSLSWDCRIRSLSRYQILLGSNTCITAGMENWKEITRKKEVANCHWRIGEGAEKLSGTSKKKNNLK